MIDKNKKEWITVLGAMVALLILMILARQAPTSKDILGAEWCNNKGSTLATASEGRTKRPPYHIGEFKPKKKLTIICK